MDLRTAQERFGSAPSGRDPSVARTLARVDADLRRGHTFPAVQRLTTLVQQNPTDLELRARLARVHLSTGNLVEAGRWGYLGADRDPDAQRAFDKAYRQPVARLHALRWRGGPHEVADVRARVRLLRLIEDATRYRQDGAGTSRRARRRWTRVDLAVLAGILVVVSVWLVGAMTVVRWLV